MKESCPGVIWLASWPRSGNTLLRAILWHRFGLRSASVYANDLEGNTTLESYAGHLERGPAPSLGFGDGELKLVKTHEKPMDAGRAIYVVRDGRAACVSLWHYWGGEVPMEDVIEGRHRFGTWADHLEAWKPWERPDTLLIDYRDLTERLPMTLGVLADFLGREVLPGAIPEREKVAQAGRWVRASSDWRDSITRERLELFDSANGSMFEKLGYAR